MADHDTHDHTGVPGVGTSTPDAADVVFDPTGLDNTSATDVQAAMEDYDAAITAAGGGTPAFIGCRAYNAGQTISNNSTTATTYGTEEYDTNTLHSTASNQSHFVADRAGYWRFNAHGLFVGNATGIRLGQVRKNGTTLIEASNYRVAVNGSSEYIPIICDVTVLLAMNDYLELLVYQNSGGDLAYGDSSAYQASVEFSFQGT